jgi:hypothetical protein
MREPTRRVLHALLVISAGVVWIPLYMLLVIASVLLVVADKVLPNARVGNCWSFAIPRMLKHGGYIAVRAAPGVAISGGLMVPHAIWMKNMHPESEVRQTSPLVRRKNSWLPWFVFYFKFKVVSNEGKPSSTGPMPLDKQIGLGVTPVKEK